MCAWVHLWQLAHGPLSFVQKLFICRVNQLPRDEGFFP